MGLDFSGTDQYVQVDDHALLDQVAITMEMWIYAHSFVNETGIVGRYDPGDPGWILWFHETSGAARLLVPMPDAWDISIITGNVLSIDTWHHLAFVAGAGAAEVFVDFVSAGTDTGGTDVKSLANKIYIGAYREGALELDGVISEVRYWKVKRTLAQLRTNAYRRIGAQPNLIGYWPLMRGWGSIAYDRSGNGLNGSLVNTPTWCEGYPIPLGAGPVVL